MKTYHDENGTAIKGLSRGETWNGWEVIYVTRKELVKWMDSMGCASSFDNEGGCSLGSDLDTGLVQLDDYIPVGIDGLYSLEGYCIS